MLNSAFLPAFVDVGEVDVLYLLVVVPVLFYCFWGSHKDAVEFSHDLASRKFEFV